MVNRANYETDIEEKKEVVYSITDVRMRVKELQDMFDRREDAARMNDRDLAISIGRDEIKNLKIAKHNLMVGEMILEACGVL